MAGDDRRTPATDGHIQALDQVANWVRFADTKATVLTAGLAASTTMLAANLGTITKVLELGCWPTAVVGGLLGCALAAFVYTVVQLVRAIGPRTTSQVAGPNRFAWPTLATLSSDSLAAHLERTSAGTDAWRQVLELAGIAKAKYAATNSALRGFAVFIVATVACIGVAQGVLA
jgi:hypothetical protein